MTYDGKSNPYTHISHFHQTMPLQSENEAFMCKVFPSSLGETELQQFDKLLTGSMSSWKQLLEASIARFVTKRKVPKVEDALLALKKGHWESLQDYARRY